METISVIGLGPVGLCTSVAFASRGFTTTGVDLDKRLIKKIDRGEAPYYERDLQQFLRQTQREGLYKATTNLEDAVLHSNMTFITVGTPANPDGTADLTQVEQATRQIGKALRQKEGYHLVTVKSTVIPTTTKKLVSPILEKESAKAVGPKIGLCANPEFLREGTAIEDTLNPDRIVIGEYDKTSGDTLERLYMRLHQHETPPIIRTTMVNAEIAKYAANAFLATKISFVNQIANLCQKLQGADVAAVAETLGYDKRIGGRFLRAGLGYGGPCFPKDVKALLHHAKSLGVNTTLLEAADHINEQQPHKALKLAKELLGSLKKKRVAVLGLAFKPNTDDIRGAVSLKVIEDFLLEGSEVSVYDPTASDKVKDRLGGEVYYAESAEECLKGADCCIIATEWKEFRDITPQQILEHMRTPNIVDGRRTLQPNRFQHPISLRAIGLGPDTPKLRDGDAETHA